MERFSALKQQRGLHSSHIPSSGLPLTSDVLRKLGLKECLVQIPQDVVEAQLARTFLECTLCTTCVCLSESFTVVISSELQLVKSATQQRGMIQLSRGLR